MVVFTCNDCGEALKRQAVEKHSFKCNPRINISCMDCHKDFRGKEFMAHPECISEAERYSGKGYKPKANINKGAKKQAAWVEMVRNIQATQHISQNVSRILTTISEHDNIPRKRQSFINFLQNSFRYMKMNDVEEAWGLLEGEMKKSKEATNGTVQNGTKRKHENDEEEQEVTPVSKKVKVEENKNEIVAAKFDWTETMRDIVMSKNNQIKLKKFKKKVFDKYKNFYNVSTITDKFEKKFTKRLTKMGLVVEDDTVRLID